MALEELYRKLRTGHVQAQAIVDTIEVPLVVLDEHLRVCSANPAFLEAFREEKDHMIGQSILKICDENWCSPELEGLLRNVIPKASALLDYEVSHTFPKIGPKKLCVSARRLSNPDTTAPTILVQFEDVTKERNEAARLELVNAEVKHRFKNFLALVSALARQSPSDGITVAEYRDSLLGRIDALAQAELLIFGNECVEVGELIRSVSAPYGKRFDIADGPEFRLAARQAATLSMILHELATNAAKHGALASETGQIHLRYSVDSKEKPEMKVLWQESDSRPTGLDVKPTGFGSRLIQLLARDQLGGSVDINMRPQGLEVVLAFPVRERATRG